MTGFEQLTTSLKQKWLQFFQLNRPWLTQCMDVEPIYTPDGGRRPPAHLILGVVNVLEPQLKDLMLPFYKLNSDADALVEVLGLNFDPDIFLGNNFNPAMDLEALREALLDEDSEQETPEKLSGAKFDKSGKLLSAADADLLADMSLDEIVEAMGLKDSDDKSVGTKSTDNLAENRQQTTATEQQDESGDESLNIWKGTRSDAELKEKTNSEPTNRGESSSFGNQKEGKPTLGNQRRLNIDEKHSTYDTEISRLFPNF